MNSFVIAQSQVTSMVEFSQQLGIPVVDIIKDAVADWIENIGPARIDSISHFDKPKNVIPFVVRRSG